MIYELLIPAIANINIEIVAENRDKAVSKAFEMIKNKELNSVEWKFVKNIEESIGTHNVITSKLYINEGDMCGEQKYYLVSIPSTCYTRIKMESSNEINALNKALLYLRFNKCEVFNIKPHIDILSAENILREACVDKIQ